MRPLRRALKRTTQAPGGVPPSSAAILTQLSEIRLQLRRIETRVCRLAIEQGIDVTKRRGE